VVSDKDAADIQAKRTPATPSLELTVPGGAENKTVTLDVTGLADQTCSVGYYITDIEMLFTSSPFVSTSEGNRNFKYVQPNYVQKVRAASRFEALNVLACVHSHSEHLSHAHDPLSL
jgi:hypothetical protein